MAASDAADHPGNSEPGRGLRLPHHPEGQSMSRAATLEWTDGMLYPGPPEDGDGRPGRLPMAGRRGSWPAPLLPAHRDRSAGSSRPSCPAWRSVWEALIAFSAPRRPSQD
ncbi:MAG: hypothetical protein M0C28_03855 [Candidatus Moduliflexus flocculans]|nr:hypothetical protein [Candidatus Moduliflexus flocculans]